MARFGDFQTIQQLHATALGAVYTARRASGGDDQFALKTCLPDIDVLGVESAQNAVRGFLDSARLQQKIHASGLPGSLNWAAVHELGTAEGGAFAVSDLARRGSCERLIGGPGAVDEKALANIFRSVAQALSAAKAAAGRAHGNLRPSNVLIMDDRPASESAIALCDPAPPASDRDFADDLNALGRLIYALVMKKDHAGGWPVAESPAWNALGPTGPGWRDLVNRLLDPAVASGTSPVNIDTLPSLLPGATAAKSQHATVRRKPGLLLAAVAAGVLLAASGGYLLFNRNSGPPDDPAARTFEKWAADPQAKTRWEQVCTEYYHWASLFTRLDTPPSANTTRARAFKARADLYASLAPRPLVDALAPFRAAQVQSPDVIAGKPGGAFLTLRSEPPQLATSDAGVRKTGELLDQLNDLKEFLVKELPVVTGVEPAAAEFKKHGWNDAAAFTDDLLSRHREATSAQPWTGAVPQIVDEFVLASPLITEINAGLARLTEIGAQLSATQDPYLSRFSSAIDQLISSGAEPAAGEAALTSLLNRVKQALAVGDEAGAFIKDTWPLVERDSLQSSEEYKRLAATSGMDVPGLRAFVAEARNHPSLPASENPVPRVVEALDHLNTQAAEHDRVAKRKPLDPATVARVKDLDSRLAALKSLTWVRKNRQRIETDAAAITADTTALTSEIDRRASDYKAAAERSRSEAVTTLRARDSISASPQINQIWTARRDRLLRDMAEADAEDLQAAASTLTRGLQELDALFTSIPPADASAPEWARALAQTGQSARERFIRRALDSAGPDADPAAMTEAGRAAAAEFADWGNSVRQMRLDGDAIDKSLADGRSLDEPAAEGRSISDLWNRILASPATRDATVSQAVAPLKSRVENLRTLASERTPSSLLSSIDQAPSSADGFAAAWPAWSRLASADLHWPADAQQLDAAPATAQKIVALLGKAPLSADRRTELVNRFSKSMAERWTSYVHSLSSGPEGAAALKKALAIAPRLGVREADIADPTLQYNIALAALTARLDTPNLSDEDARSALNDFLTKARALPGAIASRARQSIDRLAPLAAPKPAEPPPPDPTTFGPATKGWKGAALDEGRVLEFTQGAAKLRFLRIEFSREGFGPDTVYIGDREVSIAMFNTIAASARGGWSGLAGVMGFDPEDDGWIGPRAWSWKGTSPFTDNPFWVAPAPAFQASKPYYAPGLRVEGAPGGRTLNDKTGGKPASNMPMQLVSASASILAADAAGCRLPTSEEWRAVHQQFAASTPKDAWNLRDATFNRQQDYILGEIRQTLGAAATQYPAPDDGSFAARERGSCESFDDGVLWFRAVDADQQPLHNLVGNVAEFVYANPGLPSTDPAAPVAILGRSALSPADLDALTPTPVARSELRSGYTDVGFRLAFSATGSKPKPPPLAQQARQALGPEPFILGN